MKYLTIEVDPQGQVAKRLCTVAVWETLEAIEAHERDAEGRHLLVYEIPNLEPVGNPLRHGIPLSRLIRGEAQ